MILGIDPTVDYAFKWLYGRQRNSKLSAHLLNALLGHTLPEPIVDLQIENPFNDKQSVSDKLSIFDIKAKAFGGYRFNVEMQMLYHHVLGDRLLYYWARYHQSQLLEGQGYHQLQPTVSVCFLNGAMFPDIADCHFHFQLKDERHKIELTPQIQMHVFQLDKFTKTLDVMDPKNWTAE